MQSIITKLKKIEKTFGSMKFAVTIILIFTAFLIYGTFMESYHGAEFANRQVYKSWWFMGLQLLMFISIVVATYMRFPLKKRLYGFYTIHAGLIILFIGSFVTRECSDWYSEISILDFVKLILSELHHED